VQSDAPLELADLAAQKQTGHFETGLPGPGLSDPGLSLVRLMSSAGVMKAAIGLGE
jgi:16S rRNA C1402 (ribose-2'-O) methylase RsmI